MSYLMPSLLPNEISKRLTDTKIKYLECLEIFGPVSCQRISNGLTIEFTRFDSCSPLSDMDAEVFKSNVYQLDHA